MNIALLLSADLFTHFPLHPIPNAPQPTNASLSSPVQCPLLPVLLQCLRDQAIFVYLLHCLRDLLECLCLLLQCLWDQVVFVSVCVFCVYQHPDTPL